MNKIRNSRLFNQLVITMTMLVIFALLIPSVFAHFILVPQVVESRYYGAMEEDVFYLETALEGFLEKGLQDVEFMASLDVFLDLDDITRAAEALQVFIAGSQIFTGAVITNNQGDIKLFYSSTGASLPGDYNISYRDYISMPLTTGSSYISDLVATAGKEVPVIFISSPIVRDGEIQGVLALSINLWNKHNLIYKLFNDFISSRRGEIYLVDKSGYVVYHRDQELLGMKLENQAVAQAVAGNTTLLKKIFSGDKRAAAFAASTGKTGWGIIYEISYQDIYASANSVRVVVGISTVIALIAAFVSSFFIAGVILRPLELLIRTTEAVAAGNLDQELELKGHDDLHRLFKNFNKMIASLKSQREELARLSLEDYLTGLANRRYLQEHLRLELERANRLGHQSAVLMLDIDNFKKLNDLFGHLEGDRALKSLADVLRENLREMDLPARFGGEEFVVILPETSLMESLLVANKLCHKVREIQLNSRKGKIHFTVSIGVAGTEQLTFPSEPNDSDYELLAEAILQKADEALYLAKNSGKNQACLNTPQGYSESS